MADLHGWTPPLDAGPFRFGPRSPRRLLEHLTVEELVERARARIPGVVEIWRSGTHRERAGRLLRSMMGVGKPLENLDRYPIHRGNRAIVRDLLEPHEIAQLEGDT